MDDQSEATRNDNTTKDKYQRIKNVFKFLITYAPFLIDDKSAEKCEGLSTKDQFAIKIDSIRKSLDIESMEDVQLLVDELYKFEEWNNQRLEEETKKVLEKLAENKGDASEEIHTSLNDQVKKGVSNEPTLNGNNNNTANDATQNQEEEERDPNALNLQEQHITRALQRFHEVRKQKQIEEMPMGDKKKKKASKTKDKASEASQERKKQQYYWGQMTTILTDQKLSVWKALDKALQKYYSLLDDRQKLIEETGLLNQQNEELKTLLNSYLQAGVNQELQVPPTQVIKLDI